MRKIVLVFFVAFSLYNASAQDFEQIRYTVKMGETVRMISRKFKIAPSEIYSLNRFAVDGIREGMVLQLLVPRKEVEAKEQKAASEPLDATETTQPDKQVSDVQGDTPPENQGSEPREIQHTVAPKETLYSLSKKYNVPVDEIRRQNEVILRKGLKTGQVLIIRTTN